MYLTRDEVFATLRSIVGVAPSGSTVIFDYYDTEAFIPEKADPQTQEVREELRQIGEPMRTGFDPSTLAVEMAGSGFRLHENVGPSDIPKRYFLGRKDSYHAVEYVHFALHSHTIKCESLHKEADKKGSYSMKIAVVNGSHRGKNGNTNIMATAFLTGAQEAGAETVNIFLAEKEVKYCRACNACWFISPGQCVIKDDMAEILSVIRGADVHVVATPLYADNISGMLKVFMDRMRITISPYWGKDENGECRHLPLFTSPKLMLIANCGYPERSQFQVISHWIQRIARNMHTEVIGEIYAPQGALLSTQVDEVLPIVSNYLQGLETAGKKDYHQHEVIRENQEIIGAKLYF